MNIKEIVQTPYTTSPRFTPIDSVKFKDYLQEAFEEKFLVNAPAKSLSLYFI